MFNWSLALFTMGVPRGGGGWLTPPLCRPGGDQIRRGVGTSWWPYPGTFSWPRTGNAFFVRHAYFTGADDPYERLRKALKADISDEAWATIKSTVSRPFPRPTTGKIAVKVINHY